MAALDSNCFQIELMGFEDMEEVLKIERSSFPDPWNRKIFTGELENPQSYVFLLKKIMGEEKTVQGYICLWVVNNETYISNLAVDPSCQRQGIATALLYFALECSFKKKSKRAILEVREHNYPARCLYDKFDFRQIEIRPNYYKDTDESALILKLELTMFFSLSTTKKP